MAVIVHGSSIANGAMPADVYKLIDEATISGITGSDLASNTVTNANLQTITTTGKVTGAAITALASLPGSAGIIPVANIDTGTTANKIVQLTAAAKLPAVDGSLLTNVSTGAIVQVVNQTVQTVATATGNIPRDNTIPTTSEGTKVLTVAITPTSTTNNLLIQVDALVGGDGVGMHLCKTGSANAIAATCSALSSGAENYCTLSLSHFMAAGVTTELTFDVYIGKSSGSAYLNGDASGTQLFGGVASSSITVTEIKV